MGSILCSRIEDIIFFSDYNFYYDSIKNKKYNAFIDPYFEYFSKKKNCLKLEILPHFVSLKKDRFFEPVYIKLLYINLIGYIFYKIKKIFLIRNDEFYSNLSKIISQKCKFEINKNLLESKYNEIYFNSKNIEKILKVIRPKVVFLTCYYNTMSLSIILACKNLNIKTVDLQHGGIEPIHLMYRYWQKSEHKNGYKLLPNFFYLWQKEQLADSFYKKNSNHKLIEGGKIWLNKVDEILLKKKYLNNYEHIFFKSLKKYKRTILFCATDQFPECLLKAIKISQNNKNWLWLIRLHPRIGRIKLLKEKLEELKISMDNIKIEEPTSVNLFSLITQVSHVIVEQSSVAFDAAYYNKPVICLSNQPRLFQTW